jgi:hypothetical protein
MTPYETALALIAKKHRRDNPNRHTFSHNKEQSQYVEVDPDTGVVRYNYRDTDVAILSPNGDILLDTGGWPTMSTKRCMERVFTGPGNRFTIDGSCLRAGDMPRSPRPWRLIWGSYWNADHVVVAEFTNAGPPVYVDVRNEYTGRPSWGANMSGFPRQQATITASMLDIPARRAA